MKNEEALFIQVRDSLTVRRHMLGCSKQVIQLLQRYEQLKNMRIQKIERIAKLRSLANEMTLLMNKLHSSLPQAQTRAQEKTPKISTKNIEPDVSQNDLAKLEAELARIESKLQTLN